jgi:hypothetical protein
VDDQVGNNLIVGGSGISAVYDDTAGTLTLNNTASGIGLADFSAATSGIGSLVYDNTSGVFTYTGASKSEIDALGIAAATAANLTGTPNISVGTISASGTITGNLTGDVTGNVTGTSGSTTGNAATATALATARNISGVAFDGTADITLNTSAITENTNLYYTDARVQAVSINAVSEDTSPALGGNLAGGSYDITTTGKIYYANMFSTEGDLPSASTYHGMFAHVHATGKGYFAHNGNWIKLIDETNSTTDNLTEGSSNLYYTTARGNTDFDTRFATKDTDDLTQGTTNLYNQTHTGDVTGATALTIANDAVTTAKILDANVTTSKIADANITTAKILDDNITTAKILDSNVTTAKIANDAITTVKILDANVTTAKLADNAITFAKLEDRYTAKSTTSSASGTISVDWATATTFEFTASLTGATTISFTNFKQGQTIGIYGLTGSQTITLDSDAATSETFNKVGGVDYDGASSNYLQIVCVDDSATAVFNYSVATYTADTTI